MADEKILEEAPKAEKKKIEKIETENSSIVMFNIEVPADVIKKDAKPPKKDSIPKKPAQKKKAPEKKEPVKKEAVKKAPPKKAPAKKPEAPKEEIKEEQISLDSILEELEAQKAEKKEEIKEEKVIEDKAPKKKPTKKPEPKEEAKEEDKPVPKKPPQKKPPVKPAPKEEVEKPKEENTSDSPEVQKALGNVVKPKAPSKPGEQRYNAKRPASARKPKKEKQEIPVYLSWFIPTRTDDLFEILRKGLVIICVLVILFSMGILFKSTRLKAKASDENAGTYFANKYTQSFEVNSNKGDK